MCGAHSKDVLSEGSLVKHVDGTSIAMAFKTAEKKNAMKTLTDQ